MAPLSLLASRLCRQSCGCAARTACLLRVLAPAVENAVSGNAVFPLDVIKTRKGVTVEIGNTAAAGRLVLCAALTEADREKPALIIDCATLTGAARVALGTELPAMFCNDDDTAHALAAHGDATHDPVWRLPLWKPYRRMLDSKVADIVNVGGRPGGSITAACFLREFVGDFSWAHLDIAGPAFTDADDGDLPRGATGFGVRLLVDLACSFTPGD